MGLMVLASELFMMMINACVQGEEGGCRSVSAHVCVCVCDDDDDDDEWMIPSPRTLDVCCVQT